MIIYFSLLFFYNNIIKLFEMEGKYHHISNNINNEDLIISRNLIKNINDPNYFSLTKSNNNNKYLSGSSTTKHKNYYTRISSAQNKNKINMNAKNYLNDIKRKIFNGKIKNLRKKAHLKLNTNPHFYHNRTNLKLKVPSLGHKLYNNEGKKKAKNIFKSIFKYNFIKPEKNSKKLEHNSSNFIVRRNLNYSSTSFNSILNKQNKDNKDTKNESLNNLIVSQDNEFNNRYLVTEYSSKKDNDLLMTNEEIINDISLNEIYNSYNFNNSILYEDFTSLKKDFELFYTKKFIDGINHDLIELEFNLALDKIFDLLMSYNFHVEKIFNENNSYKINIKTIISRIKEINKKLVKLKNKKEYFTYTSEYKNLIKENDMNFNKDTKFSKTHQIGFLNYIFENRISMKQKLQKILIIILKNNPNLFENNVPNFCNNEKINKENYIKNLNLNFKNDSSIGLTNIKLSNNQNQNKINSKNFFTKITNSKPIINSYKSEYFNNAINKNNNKNSKNETDKFCYQNKFKAK